MAHKLFDVNMTKNNKNGEINNAYDIDHSNDSEHEENDIHKTDFQLENKSLKEKTKFSELKQWIILSLKFLVHIVVGGYFGYATYRYTERDKYDCDESKCSYVGMQFCSGYGMLVLLVAFIYFGLFYFLVFKPRVGNHIHKHYLSPIDIWWMQFSRTRLISNIMVALLAAALAIFLYFETRNQPEKLTALTAPLFFILAGYVFSTKRAAIKWRIVITGITCQFLLGIICLRWPVGRQIFECIGDKVATFLSFTEQGTRFVFGDTIVDDGVFAFAILPMMFFFSFFISILYYMGVMQRVVLKLGWILQTILGTTVCESVTAAANIFLGMSESPLLIRPYIKKLTASEIHSIMVSGFATVAGALLAAYMSFGASAAHLITSSVMAAPATLAISKLYMPETEESKTSSDNIELEKSEDSSVLDAASSGANNAIAIILGIVANIVAFVAFIAFLNAIVNWLGYLIDVDDIDFEWIFSKIFIPLAWAMGVEWKDCDKVAKVVATKSIINEFVAYERLGVYIANEEITDRSAGITTFAICGFANPSSLGILIGSLGAMAPSRRGLITSVAFRAFIVGSIVCFISASFAGILIPDDVGQETYKHFRDLRRNTTIGLLSRNN